MVKHLITFIVACFLFIYASPALASTNVTGMPFSVEPILPDNQDKGIERYISITPKSNSLTQELDFLVTNNTNEKLDLDIELLNAYTSANGSIQYTENDTENNQIINERYEMNKYLESPKSLQLSGGQKKIIKVKVNISDMEGVVLGGIAFKGKGDEEKSENQGVSFEVKNKINTVYGIAIHFKTDKKSAFYLGGAYFDPMPSYFVMRLPISLKSPLLLKEVNISYKVTYKGKRIFSSEQKMDFAPMTKTNFAIPFEHQEIVEGDTYIIKGKISYVDQNGKKQVDEFEKEVTYNDRDQQDDSTFFTMLKKPIEKVDSSFFEGIGVSIFISLIIFLVISLRKKRTKAKSLLKEDIQQ